MHLMQITGAPKPATFPKASLTLENSSVVGGFYLNEKNRTFAMSD